MNKCLQKSQGNEQHGFPFYILKTDHLWKPLTAVMGVRMPVWSWSFEWERAEPARMQFGMFGADFSHVLLTVG
jgi:hypothetical protein